MNNDSKGDHYESVAGENRRRYNGTSKCQDAKDNEAVVYNLSKLRVGVSRKAKFSVDFNKIIVNQEQDGS